MDDDGTALSELELSEEEVTSVIGGRVYSCIFYNRLH